jgi:DNA adenine methylase
MVKTFIRRPGNKTAHLKHIISLIPKFTGTYYEPFLGTGAVYLHLLPKKAVLNDINRDIIDIWRLVRDDPEYLISEINKFKKKFLPLTNQEKLKVCKSIVSKMDTYPPKKRATMYLLMIYCSYAGTLINTDNDWYISGIYRNIYIKNKSHIFTDNYSAKLRELSRVLKSLKIYNQDYSEILNKTKKGDFVFMDPPYLEKRKYVFNYNKNETFDPIKLQKQLELLNLRGVKWMMTQIDTLQVRKLFEGYRFYSYTSRNNLAAVHGPLSSKKELIIMNY